MLTSNNINHTHILDYIWDDDIEKMFGIRSLVANM